MDLQLSTYEYVSVAFTCLIVNLTTLKKPLDSKTIPNCRLLGKNMSPRHRSDTEINFEKFRTTSLCGVLAVQYDETRRMLHQSSEESEMFNESRGLHAALYKLRIHLVHGTRSTNLSNWKDRSYVISTKLNRNSAFIFSVYKSARGYRERIFCP